MGNITDTLRAEIEATASATGLSASTVGERAGQGGRFYARLCAGKRVWPETAERVRAELHKMVSPSVDAPSSEGADAKGSLPAIKRGHGDVTVQGQGPEKAAS